ncbi:DUF982 domain-containing protein [Bosea vestrisii]|uniref:DUF982 domain-containing protein n=1 Tax=Bosea vestrisii TaxID=151416 RepID=UPI0024DF6365|nr:DUF982 domain-containing protein [Bosea vestrisii]WID98412.1 DUF982 domain-containing protein [Bosea vestrisii]
MNRQFVSEWRAMWHRWFSSAVYVETDRAGTSCAVTSVEKAAELLMVWPERGNEWEEAFRACAAAIHGKGTAVEARSAFEKAAAAANRLILATTG